ncbi:MAG: carbonic anhydrase family protein [Pseudomonadota bacterium]
MKLHLLSSGFAVLCASLSGSALAQDIHAAHPSHHAQHPHHWSYTGATGTTHWSELEADFATCKVGHAQSPINILGAVKAELPAIGFNYAATAGEVINNGHTIQVNLPPGSSVSLGGGTYQLLQFHFHTPSEERINGKSFPLVAHMVHRNEEGKLAVVAVLFKLGKEHPVLAKIFAVMPHKEGGKAALPALLNPADLLPAKQAYYSFMGSLTTPPCTEGVRWQVLEDPVEISHAQLNAFHKLYRMNARPVQPLNGRDVRESS